MSKKITVLSVCGSGVVTSSMVANQIKEMFSEEGYDVTTVECMPMELENLCATRHFDLIAYASPISDNYGIPALSSIGLVTGMGEDEFKEEALEIFKKAGK